MWYEARRIAANIAKLPDLLLDKSDQKLAVLQCRPPSPLFSLTHTGRLTWVRLLIYRLGRLILISE
jgi:hypothetical protein